MSGTGGRAAVGKGELMKLKGRPIASINVLVFASALLAVGQESCARADQPPAVAARGVMDDTYEHAIHMPTGSPTPQAKAYSPYAGRSFPTRVLWGDTHFHTANSGDAFTAGTRFTPEQGYRIARGEEVISTTGLPARLPRPLDFLVISDHSEGLGLMTEVYNGNPVLMSDSTLRRWSRMIKAGGTEASAAVSEVIGAEQQPAVGADQPQNRGPAHDVRVAEVDRNRRQVQ
jgi:hypothetical protein